jgi:hypothetical protein
MDQDHRNIGVIGARIYQAAVMPPPPMYTTNTYQPTYNAYHDPYNQHAPRGIAASTGLGVKISAKMATAPINIMSANTVGTGFGAQTDFVTQTVSFLRGAVLATLLIYYSDKRGLRQRGIVMSRRRVGTRTPDAFPVKADACQPPPLWRG